MLRAGGGESHLHSRRRPALRAWRLLLRAQRAYADTSGRPPACGQVAAKLADGVRALGKAPGRPAAAQAMNANRKQLAKAAANGSLLRGGGSSGGAGGSASGGADAAGDD